MYIFYTNSVLASIVSLSSCGLALFGIYGFFDKEIPAGVCVLFIVLGAGGLFWANRISENKKFKKWLKKVQEQGLENNIRSSVPDAVAVYNTCPMPQTLKYIRSLNPSAADQIEQLIAANKQKNKK